MIKKSHPARVLLSVLVLLVFGGFTVFAAGMREQDAHHHDHHDDHHHEDSMSIPHIDAVNLGTGERLRVIASTNIIADVVRNVAGDAIDLTTIIPNGQNPHAYEPPPRVIGQVERAHLVFVNGLNLEEGLMDAINRVATGYVVPVSAGIHVLGDEDHDHDHDHHADDHHHDDHDHDHDDHDHDHDHHADDHHHDDHDDHDHDHDHHADDHHHDDHDDHDHDHHADDHHHDHDHADGDPHFWLSPLNVIIWTENIVHALVDADPRNAATYRANGEAYIAELRELDREIRQAVARIPRENRKLVMDHVALTYFAADYGFEIIGEVIPSVSDQAEPSARHIAQLTQVIRNENVPAIFVGGTANRGLRNLVHAVADEVGRDIRIGEILTGSLAASGSRGDTYLDYMRYNTEQITNALTR